MDHSEHALLTIIHELMKRTAPLTGEKFFRALTQGLAELINVEQRFIAFATDTPPSRVRVEASWFKGQDRESWEYDLVGNPCRLPHEGRPTFIPCDVGQKFISKKDSGYQSFIGLPLCDSETSVIGHLAAYASREMAPGGPDLQICELFAQRAEAEARRNIMANDLRRTVLALETVNERLKEESSTDSLTGLMNRRTYVETAEREFRRARRNDRDVGLLFIDLNHFKAVNDNHGHAVGDKVLVASAAAIRSAIRQEVDSVARFGGEEFVVLMPEAGETVTKRVAASILEAVRSVAINLDGAELCPTCSIGHTIMRDSDDSWEDMLVRSDSALYHAKDQGRDRASVG